MIVYSGTKERFQRDVMSNDIGNIIYDAFKGATGHSTPRNQITAWTNSLQYMDRVLGDDAIPNDAGVAIEYHIPRSSKRIDFILTGTDAAGAETAVRPHPSYQAWTYNPNPAGLGRIPRSSGPRAKRYARQARGGVCRPEGAPAMRGVSSSRNLPAKCRPPRIDHGKIKPSKSLADSLASMLKGNREFVMVDDQKIVYETALALAATAATGKKQVLIVEGGPGTGKSVVAVNLLVELTRKDLVAQYVTRNSAPRLVYAARLAGTLRRNRIDSMFRSSETFHAAPANEYDCLLVDEAHRLKEKSGMFDHLGENQVKELINAARLSVFFIDEDQKVTRPLSDGYLAWLDNALQVGRTANETLDTRDYDFQVIDDPARLHALIRDRNGGNKARMVAGYCPHTCQGLELDYVGVIVGPDLVVRDGEVITSPAARAGTDRSLHGWRALHKHHPAAAGKRLDLLIKNTYRTLMTRGHNPNPALRRIPREAGGGPSAMRARPDGVYASRRAPAMRAESCSSNFQAKGFLPVLSLEAACGAFGRGMAVEPRGWAKCPPGLKPDRNMFIARVSGRSMEPKLHDGDYCVFRTNVAGTRQGKIVLVQHSSISDPDTGGSYTVKKYASKKKYAPDGTWQHEEIVLKPLNPEYDDIVIQNAETEDFMVVAEVVGKCVVASSPLGAKAEWQKHGIN